MKQTQAQSVPARAPIKSRRVEFDFDSIEQPYWFGDNPVATAVLGALSAVFPPGEKEFVRSVMFYRDRITDKKLLADIRGFAAQEGSHSNQHRHANDWLDRNGYGASEITAMAEEFNKDFVDRFPPRVHLALTVVMEHITAILAEYALTHPEKMAQMPAPVREMLEWHAVEEIEHKAVAFDVYDEVVGDRNLLRLVFLAATWMFITYTAKDAKIALGDRKPTRRQRLEAAALLFAPSGIVPSVIGRYLDFFRKDFHPWQHDNQHLIEAWKARQAPKAQAAA